MAGGVLTFSRRASRALEKEIRGHARRWETGAVRGLNKSAAQGRTIASRIIRAKLNLRVAAVNQLLPVKKASRRRLRSSLQAIYQGVPVIAFTGVRQTRRGVSVRMRKDKPRKLFQSAFIQRMRSGHRGVFRRARRTTRWTRGRPRTSTPNLPIYELRGPNLYNLFGENIELIINQSFPEFEKILEREIAFALRP